MNLPRFLAAAAVSSIAAFTAVGALSADKPAVARAPALPDRRPAPAALSAAVRAARVKTALQTAGLPSAIIPNTGTRLTPIAPAHPSGAAITYAGPGVLLGAAPGEPHGSFVLMNSSVKMRFPTAANKVYVLTCRFELFSNPPKITVKREGAAAASIPIENGHMLYAFLAGGPTTNVSLEAVPPNNFPSAGFFYGCDLDG